MKDNLYNVVNELRCLVFLETEPQSNLYNQVLLTEETFHEMSKVISGEVVRKEGDIEVVDTQLSDEVYKLPDLQSTI